jgi:hypothetical protein
MMLPGIQLNTTPEDYAPYQSPHGKVRRQFLEADRPGRNFNDGEIEIRSGDSAAL